MQSILTNRPGRGGDTRHIRLPEPLNERLTLLDERNACVKVYGANAADFSSEAGGELLGSLDESEDFSKLLVYSESDDKKAWEAAGFAPEGTIHGFFFDGSSAHIWAKYTDEERATISNEDELEEVLKTAVSKSGADVVDVVPDDITVTRASPEDAETISELMQSVFSEYPHEITEERLKQLISRGGSAFRIARNADGALVASAAVRLDLGRRSGEVRDCVTHEGFRGRGIMTALILGLENDSSTRFGVKSLYSLARAAEPGINVILARLGYEHSGRLINDSRMPNGWESMNVWCKGLD